MKQCLNVRTWQYRSNVHTERGHEEMMFFFGLLCETELKCKKKKKKKNFEETTRAVDAVQLS
jgi:hypothetical protein